MDICNQYWDLTEGNPVCSRVKFDVHSLVYTCGITNRPCIGHDSHLWGHVYKLNADRMTNCPARQDPKEAREAEHQSRLEQRFDPAI